MKTEQEATNADWVEQTLARLSLKEKIAQTTVEHVEKVVEFSRWQDEEAIKQFLAQNPLGGIFIGGKLLSKPAAPWRSTGKLRLCCRSIARSRCWWWEIWRAEQAVRCKP
ncbi:MAG: hypothetical protein K0R57_33 [Paenibacillaceae bacterium]|jgi:hypothetical protein|nr:hypothetical protein [Paenibacillaceae bacterium]